MILRWVIILFLLFTITGCQQTPQRPHLRALSARDYYPIALEKARQWRPDAYLSDISVDVLAEEEIERSLRVTFGFESPSDDRHSLLIFFREDSDEPQLERVEHRTPISVRNPISSEDWPVDSVKALAIALDNGGSEFLTKHDPEMMNLYLERLPTVPGARLKWRASFWDWSPDELIWIMIDPRTGDVIEVERQPSR
jgi:hypothetical protein